MIQIVGGEEFKEIQPEGNLQLRYAISNYGRLVSFTDDIQEGRIVKGTTTDGYRIFRYKIRVNEMVKHKHKFFYRMVAESFLPKQSEDQMYVLHLDRNRLNVRASNLKWATKEEMLDFQNKSPYVLAARKKRQSVVLEKGHKLTSTQVMHLKRLQDPNRKTRIKMLAKQFGISETHLYRIKNGENWGKVNV